MYSQTLALKGASKYIVYAYWDCSLKRQACELNQYNISENALTLSILRDLYPFTVDVLAFRKNKVCNAARFL